MSNEMKDWIRDRKEEAEYWVAKYPFLRIKDNSVYPWLKTDVIESHWLDELPIGWLIAFGEDMCNELLEALGSYVDNFIIIQVKEKFGEMRIYYYFDCTEDNEEIKSVQYKVDIIIDKYSVLSYKTCVDCGAPADVRTVGGWIAPYCDRCYRRKYNK